MKKTFVVCLLFAFLPLLACAQGLSGLLPLPVIPDPATLLDEEPVLYQPLFYEQGRQQFDAYAFSMPDSLSDFLDDYSTLCRLGGYTLKETVWENRFLCYRLLQDDRMGGALIFDDADHLLLLVLRDMAYRPLPDEVTATAAVAPEQTPSASSGVGWSWQTQTLSCPQCKGTRSCQLCHGTGIYRLYGQNVECETLCSFCNGTGVYEVTQYLPVP